MYKLAPSILSADMADFKNEIKKIEYWSDYLHIDVIDGNFIPSITFGQPVIKSLRSCSNLVFDVHLMVSNPERHIESFYRAGADIITFHREAVADPLCVINEIKKFGIKASVSICPETPISTIENVLPFVDMVLIMSVVPGKAAQAFIPHSLKKIEHLANIKAKNEYEFDIEVDGGINRDTIGSILNAGGEAFVIGSAIFGKDATVEAEWFKKTLNQFESDKRDAAKSQKL